MATKKKVLALKQVSDGVVGINVNGISKIQAAIDAYVKAMQREVNIGISTASIQKGIKGSNSVNTLRQLTATVDDKMKSYLLELTQFKSKLETIKTQYASADKNNGIFNSVSSRIGK